MSRGEQQWSSLLPDWLQLPYHEWEYTGSDALWDEYHNRLDSGEGVPDWLQEDFDRQWVDHGRFTPPWLTG